MAFQFAALAKAWPMVLTYGPPIWEAATKLYQGAKKADADISVPSALTTDGTQVDAQRLSAAIKDIEASLLTMNGQIADASLLLTKLAESNAALTEQVRSQRSWLLVLTVTAAVTATLLVVAIIIS